MKQGVFIGMTCLDNIYYINDKITPNKKYKTSEYYIDIGGPAANAAITYSLLGGSACLITSLGNSKTAEMIKNKLKNDYNITVIDCSTSENMHNNASIIVNLENATRTIISGQCILEATVDSQLIPKNNALFYFFDCNCQEISLELLEQIKPCSIPVILDVGSYKPNIEKFLKKATHVIASSDFKTLDGTNAFEFAKQHNVSCFAVSDGSNPTIWMNGNKSGSIAPIQVNAIDTLGAGDVLHGAFCYYFACTGLDFQLACSKAMDVASYSTEKKGISAGIRHFLEI